MRKLSAVMLVAVLTSASGLLWSHGGGHGTPLPSSGTGDDMSSHYRRLEKIENKIMKIEKKLEDKNLSAKKRAKLEKKLKKLVEKKKKLLDGH